MSEVENKIVLKGEEYILHAPFLPIGRAVCEASDGTKYFLKTVEENGLIAYRDVLPKLPQETFRRLVLPQYRTSGIHENRHWVLIRYEEGENYHSKWNETHPGTAGGRAIGVEEVDRFLDLVEDISGIGIAGLTDIDLSQFTPESVLGQYERAAEAAIRLGLITDEHRDRGKSLLEEFTSSLNWGNLQLSNGDFQFRNFINRPDGKTVVIDWDGARFSPFELEHCIAYQWTLMWNNPRWQRELLRRARDRFSIDLQRFQAVMLFDSLHQAMVVWPNAETLRQVEIDYFINALDERYIAFVAS